ncbi:virion core protein [Bifidobacterium italicum]|uniref:Virion core protein n=2 Tax=Bifidobacterium italicum TaxID=1960968 RepID=A0A2A2EME0_9BIFI|nr:virion core protein [Bifidobacterium italicum]
MHDAANAGTWESRFGIHLAGIGIESIEFTPESRELVKQYAANRMNVTAYENVSQQASNIAAQQKIAQGVQENGFGDMGGMMLGVGFAQGVNPMTGAMPGQQMGQPVNSANAAVTPSTAQSDAAAQNGSAQPSMSLSDQMEALKNLKELLDAGILTQEEFNLKKRQILGL